MTAPLLEIRNLRIELALRRGHAVAVDDVSLDLGRGEILGVVGESGAGKSLTGLSVIGLLEPPLAMTGGQILLEGRRIDTLPAHELRRVRGREIGAIFQDPLTSLNPLFTVGRQLTETIRTHLDVTDGQARARAIDLLGEVGIPAARDRLDSYPHEFSGGMRQRVVIALAIACEPKVVIADEPTTALDVSIQAQIIDLIRRLCEQRGMGVILITHDMGVIAEAADRVAILYAGRLAEIGPTAAVLREPAHPYTRGLMAAIPRPGRNAGPLAQIEGAMPRLTAMPPGCAFHPRCTLVHDLCRRVRPDPVAAGATRAACHLLSPAESGHD